MGETVNIPPKRVTFGPDLMNIGALCLQMYLLYFPPLILFYNITQVNKHFKRRSFKRVKSQLRMIMIQTGQQAFTSPGKIKNDEAKCEYYLKIRKESYQRKDRNEKREEYIPVSALFSVTRYLATAGKRRSERPISCCCFSSQSRKRRDFRLSQIVSGLTV